MDAKRYRCCLCPFVFGQTDELRAHLSVDHMKWIPFQCQFCHYVYLPTSATVRAHFVQAHQNTKPSALYDFDEKKPKQLKALLQKSLAQPPLLEATATQQEKPAKIEATKRPEQKREALPASNSNQLPPTAVSENLQHNTEEEDENEVIDVGDHDDNLLFHSYAVDNLKAEAKDGRKMVDDTPLLTEQKPPTTTIAPTKREAPIAREFVVRLTRSKPPEPARLQKQEVDDNKPPNLCRSKLLTKNQKTLISRLRRIQQRPMCRQSVFPALAGYSIRRQPLDADASDANKNAILRRNQEGRRAVMELIYRRHLNKVTEAFGAPTAGKICARARLSPLNIAPRPPSSSTTTSQFAGRRTIPIGEIGATTNPVVVTPVARTKPIMKVMPTTKLPLSVATQNLPTNPKFTNRYPATGVNNNPPVYRIMLPWSQPVRPKVPTTGEQNGGQTLSAANNDTANDCRSIVPSAQIPANSAVTILPPDPNGGPVIGYLAVPTTAAQQQEQAGQNQSQQFFKSILDRLKDTDEGSGDASQPTETVEMKPVLPLPKDQSEKSEFDGCKLIDNPRALSISPEKPPVRPSSPKTISCRLCNKPRMTGWSKKICHIWMSHMVLPMAECAYCAFRIYAPSSLKAFQKHTMERHPDKETKWIDNRRKLKTAFDQKCSEAFSMRIPDYASMANCPPIGEAKSKSAQSLARRTPEIITL